MCRGIVGTLVQGRAGEDSGWREIKTILHQPRTGARGHDGPAHGLVRGRFFMNNKDAKRAKKMIFVFLFASLRLC